MLIAVHELVEAILCKAHGVSQETVDKWDMGTGKALQEPGNDPRAPYHAEHVVAEGVEAIVGSHLKIEWLEHTHNVWNLELPDDLKRSSDLPSERTGD